MTLGLRKSVKLEEILPPWAPIGLEAKWINHPDGIESQGVHSCFLNPCTNSRRFPAPPQMRDGEKEAGAYLRSNEGISQAGRAAAFIRRGQRSGIPATSAMTLKS